MTEENVRLIREGYEAINRRDLAWIRDHADPDVEFQSRFSGVAGRMYRGPGAVEEWFTDIDESWASMRQTPERFVELEDGRTIAEVRIQARGRESGVEIDQRIAVIYTISEGRVLRMEAHESLDHALVAVGDG